jgi:hypothetical protein
MILIPLCIILIIITTKATVTDIITVSVAAFLRLAEAD